MRCVVAGVFILLIMYPSFCWPEEIAPSDAKAEIVVSDEDIKEMNVHRVVDLLNQLPGVSATETSVRIRGFSTKQILVLLDGRVINNPVDPHRRVNWSMISLNSIEKIEIYKGTGSVLYGDDTSGGVISITTKETTKGSSGNIEASYGRFDSQNYDLNYRQQLGVWGSEISAGWEKTDGFRDNGDKDKKRVGTKLSYEIKDGKPVILSFDYSRQDSGKPGRSYSPTPRARSNERAFGSTFLCQIGELKTGTYFSNFEKRYRNPDNNKDNVLENWSLNEDLKFPVSAGYFGPLNMGVNLETAHAKATEIDPRDEQKYAVYATKDIDFKDIPLSLNLGLRTNFYSEFPTAINPQIQVGYKYKGLDIKFSAARANNTPTFRQRYYETTYVEANPDLGMGKATNLDLSFSYAPEESLDMSISFFFNDITDRITYVKREAQGKYENLGSVTRKGIETSVHWKHSDLLLIKSSYTFLIAKDEDTKKYLTRSPKHRIMFDIQYKPFRNLSLGLYTKYVAKMFVKTDNSQWLEDYFVANFRADYTIKEGFELFFKVANLFDNDYEIDDGYPAAPITPTLGAKYEF